MKDRQIKSLRLYFLLGLTIAFISIFLDWYLFQGRDATGVLLVDWSYQLFLGWFSPSHLSTELNNWYKPTNAFIPLPLVLFFIGLLILTSFIALFYSPEHLITKQKNLKPFSFINGAVLLVNAFFIVLFPILYLFPNKLLYPMLVFYDYELEISYQFSMGIGYWLQLVAFACCFPYTCLCYQIANNVEIVSNNSPVESNSINLDKLIAETELTIATQQKSLSFPTTEEDSPKEMNTEEIYQHYINHYYKGGKKQ